MTEQSFYLVADVSSDDPAAIEQVLRNHVQGQIHGSPTAFTSKPRCTAQVHENSIGCSSSAASRASKDPAKVRVDLRWRDAPLL